MKNTESKSFILIFGTALTLRLLLFIAVGPWDSNVEKNIILQFDDAPSFHYVSTLIAQGKPIIAVYNKQLYQYFVALIYSLTGYKPYIVILLQILMGSFTCVLLYKTAQLILPEKIAIFAGCLLAVEYSNILYSNHMVTESMFIFLFIMHVYFFMKFLIEKNTWLLLYSAIFLGLATNVRPMGLYFPVFLIWPLILYFRNNLRRGILSFVILTSVLAVMVTPWMIRNYVVAGKFAFSHDSGGKTLIWFLPNTMNIFKPPYTMIKRWNAEEKEIIVREAEKPGGDIASVVRKYGTSALQVTRWQQQLHNGTLESDPPLKDIRKKDYGHMGTKIQSEDVPFTQRITNALLADTKSLIGRTFHFFTTLNSAAYSEILGLPVYKMTGKNRDGGVYHMIKAAVRSKSGLEWFFIFIGIGTLSYLYITGCYGIYAAVKNKKFFEIVLFTAVIIYFVIASIGAFSEGQNPRYRVPVMPFLIVLSCYGIAELIHRLKTYPAGKNKNMYPLS